MAVDAKRSVESPAVRLSENLDGSNDSAALLLSRLYPQDQPCLLLVSPTVQEYCTFEPVLTLVSSRQLQPPPPRLASSSNSTSAHSTYGHLHHFAPPPTPRIKRTLIYSATSSLSHPHQTLPSVSILKNALSCPPSLSLWNLCSCEWMQPLQVFTPREGSRATSVESVTFAPTPRWSRSRVLPTRRRLSSTLER